MLSRVSQKFLKFVFNYFSVSSQSDSHFEYYFFNIFNGKSVIHYLPMAWSVLMVRCQIIVKKHSNTHQGLTDDIVSNSSKWKEIYDSAVSFEHLYSG